uniref:Uncharacterized protein n=1 Tax=Macaca fascicularis TaxID=9541 RepID=A0A7N9D9W7_MACFA
MKLRASEGMLGEAEKSTSCSLQFPPLGQPHYPGPIVISLRKPGSWRKLGTANSEGEVEFSGASVYFQQMDCHGGVSGTIYEYGALTIDGEEYIPFKQYIGKYVLFVNVASY